ncbi:unnamed protein product [Arabis nemorensis]|uniref:Uncharacterized protein n=1 Tax=Arabis nemorensis TaxID=586526 RepID=A0A565CBL4_9BRAS|nr:unnamed protein product [Arabis nemorensis]
MASGDLWLKSGWKIAAPFATDQCVSFLPVIESGVLQNLPPPLEPPDPPDQAPPHKSSSLTSPSQPMFSFPLHPSSLGSNPNINPPHSTTSPLAVVWNLAGHDGGPLNYSSPVFRLQSCLVSFSSFGDVLTGLVCEESLEGLAHGVSLVDCKPIISLRWLMILAAFTRLMTLVVITYVTSAKEWQLGNECKAKTLEFLMTRAKARVALSQLKNECKASTSEFLVTRAEARATLSRALEDGIRTTSVESNSLQLDRAFSLASKIFKLHDLVFRSQVFLSPISDLAVSISSVSNLRSVTEKIQEGVLLRKNMDLS